MAYVGTCEATGRNDGVAVGRFQATTGNRSGEHWCSSFCATCFVQAGLPLPAGVNGAARSWFAAPYVLYERGQWRKPAEKSLPGDLVGYIYAGSPLVHHVGLQQGQWGATSMVYTVEGNVSNCVKLLMRPKRSIAVVARRL